MQAGRGGRNPEIRTLFYRLLKLLALPIHPLFVYDGINKPPFKRGKAVSGQRNVPLIQLSKRLIDLFRFPRHDAPGEAEAECANLQRAGIVDAVMSNDVDAMMFGSSLTIMNFSKESGSGTASASHVTCYRMGNQMGPSNAGIDRAGMVLFAMLSGGDYLPSGLPKCGSKLAAQISKAGFGSDLLESIYTKGSERTEQLSEWRDRLQYELEENESGYFQTKHKAVRVPQNFPDQTILEYYASPAESSGEELEYLERRLVNAWDQDIDSSEIRNFAARFFDWNYRSGARKVVRLLAEPLATYRLRLQQHVSALPPNCPSLSKSDVTMLQKVYKARTSYSTDGLTELQLDIIPIDVVGLDLLSEEPNPPRLSQETAASGEEEEEDPEISAEPVSQSPVKKRATKRYDPYVPEKIWIFETLANIGIPDVVEEWKKEQAEKNAPRKPSNRKTGPKKKGPIDPKMKHGSILKYGTLTKQPPQISQFKRAHLFNAAVPSMPDKSGIPDFVDLTGSPRKSPVHRTHSHHAASIGRYQPEDLDLIVDAFSSSYTVSPDLGVKRRSVAHRNRLGTQRGVICSGSTETEGLEASDTEPALEAPSPSTLLKGLRISYSNTSYQVPSEVEVKPKIKPILDSPSTPSKKGRRQVTKSVESAFEPPRDIIKLEDTLSSLSLLKDDSFDNASCQHPVPSKRRLPKKTTKERTPTAESTKSQLEPTTSSLVEEHLHPLQDTLGQEAEMKPRDRKPRAKKTQEPLLTQSKSEPDGKDSRPFQETTAKGTEEVHKTTNQRAKKTQEPYPTSPTSESHEETPRRRTKKKTQSPQNDQGISQHVESVTTHDGFWTADEAPNDTETSPSRGYNYSMNWTDLERQDAEIGPKNRRRSDEKTKKKHIPRVSILDLT